MHTSPSSSPRPSSPAAASSASVVRDGIEINGKTIEVARGQTLVVNLPKQPTNGYKWTVVAVPRELSQPIQGETRGDGKAGGSLGLVTFTWGTTSPQLRTGVSYPVTIGLKRPWEEKSAETVAFKVKIT